MTGSGKACSCQGVQRYADGEYYTGSYLRQGNGTQYLSDGVAISGNWHQGRFVNN